MEVESRPKENSTWAHRGVRLCRQGPVGAVVLRRRSRGGRFLGLREELRNSGSWTGRPQGLPNRRSSSPIPATPVHPSRNFCQRDPHDSRVETFTKGTLLGPFPGETVEGVLNPTPRSHYKGGPIRGLTYLTLGPDTPSVPEGGGCPPVRPDREPRTSSRSLSGAVSLSCVVGGVRKESPDTIPPESCSSPTGPSVSFRRRPRRPGEPTQVRMGKMFTWQCHRGGLRPATLRPRRLFPGVWGQGDTQGLSLRLVRTSGTPH